MSRRVKILVSIAGALLLVGLIGVVMCTLLSAPARSSGVEPSAEGTENSAGVGLPNPASVYCEEQAGRVEIRTATDGGQYGVCIFPDGSECDEWAFYHGECGQGAGPSSEVVASRRDVVLAYVAEGSNRISHGRHRSGHVLPGQGWCGPASSLNRAPPNSFRTESRGSAENRQCWVACKSSAYLVARSSSSASFNSSFQR